MYTMNNIKLKVGLMFLFFFTVIVWTVIAHYFKVKENFRGVVEKVYYSEKHTPVVFIKGQKYALSIGFYDKIQVGDSIIKNKGQDRYILVKKVTRQVISSR